MRTQRDRLEFTTRIMADLNEAGIAGCIAEDAPAENDGRMVRIRGRTLVNYASCSYLGLELDPRLVEGAVRAVRSHGIQVCASRSYLSASLYEEFEALLRQIFEAHVVVASTTTLGHFSAIPTLVDEGDAILLDHQVHASVQMACKVAQAGGVHMEVVPHNGLGRLERRVRALSERHGRIWYMADGVHSMTGKLAPTREVVALLDRYPQLRFYVDDAHGMSWCGPRGSGSILGETPLHPQMVLTTGLGKGFGTGGGLVVLPDEATRLQVQRCGPTLIFGGPLQPPVLGAAIESARIHLTPEIDELQADLRARMKRRNEIAEALGLPMTSSPDTPVGLVAMGAIEACHSLCSRLLEDGFYINPAQFPALPARRAGGRFLLTRHHTMDDIESLMHRIAYHWEPALKDAGTSPEDVYRAFRIEPPVAPCERKPSLAGVFRLETADTIEKLDRAEWDRMLGERGSLGSTALATFESVFGAEDSIERHWDFRYYIVRDEDGDPVLATCFTKSLWKADMLSPAAVSAEIEARRVEEPLYLTQSVFAMGCLLSEGNHLWLRDPADSPASRQAIEILLSAVRRDAERLECDMRVIRDIPDRCPELIEIFEDEGLMRMPCPESLVLRDPGRTSEELLARLSYRARRYQRREVEPWNDSYDFEVLPDEVTELPDDEIAHLHSLYENVRNRNLELNTFGLPENLLRAVIASPDWELVRVRESGDPAGRVIAFGAAYRGQRGFIPLFAGLDYDYVLDQGLYRQMLRQAVDRARELGRRPVYFGFGATLEKERFGAEAISSSMFLEATDLYVFHALEQHAAAVQ